MLLNTNSEEVHYYQNPPQNFSINDVVECENLCNDEKWPP